MDLRRKGAERTCWRGMEGIGGGQGVVILTKKIWMVEGKQYIFAIAQGWDCLFLQRRLAMPLRSIDSGLSLRFWINTPATNVMNISSIQCESGDRITKPDGWFSNANLTLTTANNCLNKALRIKMRLRLHNHPIPPNSLLENTRDLQILTLCSVVFIIIEHCNIKFTKMFCNHKPYRFIMNSIYKCRQRLRNNFCFYIF